MFNCKLSKDSSRSVFEDLRMFETKGLLSICVDVSCLLLGKSSFTFTQTPSVCLSIKLALVSDCVDLTALLIELFQILIWMLQCFTVANSQLRALNINEALKTFTSIFNMFILDIFMYIKMQYKDSLLYSEVRPCTEIQFFYEMR